VRRLALVALAVLVVVPAAHAARASRAPTAIGVGMREWSLTIYRVKVREGAVRFNLVNRGEDAHNLQVTGPRGYRSSVSADAVPAGGRVTLAVHLRRPGVYHLFCAKPGHEKLMRATLRVTR
jgi:hypothetical protein